MKTYLGEPTVLKIPSKSEAVRLAETYVNNGHVAVVSFQHASGFVAETYYVAVMPKIATVFVGGWTRPSEVTK